MKTLTTMAMLTVATAAPAHASHHNLGTCYQEAAYAYIASYADVDIAVARQVTPLMPAGQELLRTLEVTLEATKDAKRNGMPARTIMVLARGAMADTPVLASGVSNCIAQYY